MTNIRSDQVAASFARHFNGTPRLYFSPGRINVIGEHVDYNDGFAMPAAIDKGMYYAVRANGSGAIRLFADTFQEQYSVALAEQGPVKGWANYLLSVVNEFVKLALPVQGFDAAFGGDVPRGSGMSSSAAVEGGLAFALNDIFDCGLTRMELAQLCQRAEQGYPGVQCGIMDQFANMMGQKEEVLLLDCSDLSYEYFPLQLKDYTLVLLNSKVQHSLASSQYNLRRQQCAAGLRITGYASFREIAQPAALLPFREQMGEIVYNRCRYVVEETARARQAAACLRQGSLDEVGALMYRTQAGLSQLYEVSCPELDYLAELAQQSGVVAGSRMMGGGFGGCTINLVKAAAADDFAAMAVAAYRKKFNLQAEVYKVQTADGTHRLA